MAWFHVLRSETGSNEAPQTQRGFSFQSTGEPGSRAELIFYVFRAAMLALIAWAVAAGSERSWQLATSSESSSVLVGWSRVLILLGATIFYVLGALGTIALIMLAAGLIGGLFGFLFGTPRLESARSQALLTSPSVSTTAAAGPAGEAPATVTGPQQQQLVQQTASARGGFQMSPALTEIADWLTKIIVGLGLVQAGPISAGFGSIVQWLLRDAKLDQFFAAGAVIPAAILVGLIGGFMFGYLLMALFIGRELAHAAIDMETLQNRAYEEGERRGTIMARQKEVTYLDAVSALRGKDIDAISLGAWSEGTANMPHDVVRAAETVAVRDLDGINTPEELQAWAKAQTLLGRHRDAVKGFQKLAKIHRTADALYDLGRALQAIGEKDEAIRVFAEAKQLVSTPDATTRAQTRLAAEPEEIGRLLYADPPQPDLLLKHLQSIMDQQPAAAKDATIQMWLACALGQQYRMLAAAGASEQDLRPVSDRAYEAVKASLDAGMPLSWLQLLINPSDSRKAGQAQREREDDLEPFFMEQRFKQLLKL